MCRASLGVTLSAALLLSSCLAPATPDAQSRAAGEPGEQARERMETLEGKTLRVEWERSGGFAGMRMAATLDSESLSPEDADELRDLVEAAGFFELPEQIGGPDEGGADRFLYTVAVATDSRRHSVHTSEAAAPPALRSLIQWLTKAARKGGGSGGSP